MPRFRSIDRVTNESRVTEEGSSRWKTIFAACQEGQAALAAQTPLDPACLIPEPPSSVEPAAPDFVRDSNPHRSL